MNIFKDSVYNNCRQLIVCIYWKVCQVNKTKAMQKENRKGKQSNKPLSVRRGSANQHHLEQPPCLVDPSHIVPGYCLHLSWISLQPSQTRKTKKFQNYLCCHSDFKIFASVTWRPPSEYNFLCIVKSIVGTLFPLLSYEHCMEVGETPNTLTLYAEIYRLVNLNSVRLQRI